MEPAVFKAGGQFKARSGVDNAVHRLALLVCRARFKPVDARRCLQLHDSALVGKQGVH